MQHIADWLYDLYPAYLAYLDSQARYPYEGQKSGDWDSGKRVRVSRLAGCPKQAAALAAGQISKPEHTALERQMMVDGVRRAEVVYEALAWGCSENSEVTFTAEQRIVDSNWLGLSGTIDGVLTYQGVQHPIEVKSTEYRKYGPEPRGIWHNYLVQCAGEMALLAQDEASIPTGFLYVCYTRSSITHQVYTVTYDSRLKGFFPMLGNNYLRADSAPWTVLPDGRVFWSLDELKALVNLHQYWMDQPDPLNAERPYQSPFESWDCGKLIRPTKRTPRGNFIVRCPAFGTCFSRELSSLGYDEPPQEIPVRLADDEQVSIEFQPE